MRLFVALDISAEIRERIAGFIARLRQHAVSARWVNAESLHVTLKFLGEVPESRLEAVQEKLRSVEGAALPICFKGTGFFPTPKSARVFWIGIEAGQELAMLARRIEEALRPLGFEPEQRAFSPHLTLARKSDARRPGGRDPGFSFLQEALAKENEADFGTMTAEDFFLFQSKLSPRGAAYTKLTRFPLRPAA